jgi:branched-chain amino acid transport system ATP-binding protein
MFFEIKNLKKWFGGVKAVNGVSLHVNEGDICSIIGPNGAGKTTLFNLITGYVKPDMGQVLFRGEDLTGRSPQFITRRGIARSFQIVNIFPKLTVYENIMIATLAHHEKTLNIINPAKKLLKAETYQLLESVGLAEARDVLGGQLSHGNQKRLEVGIALTMKPKFLLLDEPTSGMAAEEKSGILQTVRDMMLRERCTVFLCEHDMSVIFGVSDMIWVLANGQVIANGTVAEIRADETVRKVYLGEK